MQSVNVRPVRSKQDLADFIHLPWKIYANNPNWVPPLLADQKKRLDVSKNPFFQHSQAELFLAYQGGALKGRVAAIVNRLHNDRQGDKAGFFGYFEASDDPPVFGALMQVAEAWLKQQGCNQIIGPLNPDTNNDLGFLVEGFDSPPFFMLAHTPPYYDERIRRLGYRKARDFYSYIVQVADFSPEGKLKRVEKAILRRYPLTVRAGNIARLESELQLIGEIYNDAFAGHWGFVPMTAAEIKYMAEDLKLILDPELVLFVEHKGEPAGFLLALPNYNEVFQRIRDGKLFPTGLLKLLYYRRKIQSVRVLTVATKKKYAAMGLGSVLYAEAARRIIARGYAKVEMSWVVEDNLMMNRAAHLLGGKAYKTYRVYQKDI